MTSRTSHHTSQQLPHPSSSVSHGRARSADLQPIKIGSSHPHSQQRRSILHTRTKWRMLLKSVEVGPPTGVVDADELFRHEAGLHGVRGVVLEDGESTASGRRASESAMSSMPDVASTASSAAHQRMPVDRAPSMDLAILSALDAAMDAVDRDNGGSGVEPVTGGIGEAELLFSAAADANDALLGAAASQLAQDLGREGRAHGPIDAPTDPGSDGPSLGALSRSRPVSASSLPPVASGLHGVTVDVVMARDVRQEVWREAAADMASNYPSGMFAKLTSEPTIKERAIRRDVGRTFAAFGSHEVDGACVVVPWMVWCFPWLMCPGTFPAMCVFMCLCGVALATTTRHVNPCRRRTACTAVHAARHVPTGPRTGLLPGSQFCSCHDTQGSAWAGAVVAWPHLGRQACRAHLTRCCIHVICGCRSARRPVSG